METVKTEREEYINTRTHSMDLNSSDKIVHSLDVSGTVLDVSPGWLKITGYTRDEVIGRHFVEFLDLHSLMNVRKNFPCLKDYGYVNGVKISIMRKDRTIVHLRLNGTSKYDSNGVFERTFCEMTPVESESSI